MRSRSAYGFISRTAASQYVRSVAREGIPVRPLPVGAQWVSEQRQPRVGMARTLAEAERLCRAAGYRMLVVGGLVEESHDGKELLITVQERA